MVITRSRGSHLNVDATQESLIAKLEDGWRRREATVIAACFAPRGVCEVRFSELRGRKAPASRAVSGPAAIGTIVARLIADFPSIRFGFTAVGYGSDRRIWTEWNAVDVGAGEALSACGVMVFRVGARGIEHATLYLDTGHLRAVRRWIDVNLPKSP